MLSSERIAELVGEAKRAREHAYAPYSAFPVGAALLLDSGAIVTAANVENASFGLSICAERAAVVRAVAQGSRRYLAIAIVGPKELDLTPCGACRQFLSEFGLDLTVVTMRGGEPRAQSLRELLPDAFDAESLP
ncbi:MAG: cytidine deaminase [Candidatus Baltobacteraceae bacterium]